MDRTIPKEELDKIEARVMNQVRLVWDVGLEFVPLELIDEWLQEHHRVLDVEDFARV